MAQRRRTLSSSRGGDLWEHWPGVLSVVAWYPSDVIRAELVGETENLEVVQVRLNQQVTTLRGLEGQTLEHFDTISVELRGRGRARLEVEVEQLVPDRCMRCKVEVPGPRPETLNLCDQCWSSFLEQS
jgi:hypothetical protein